MRRAWVGLGLALLLVACAAGPAAAPAAPKKPFHMTMYYMAILRRGPAWKAAGGPEAKELLAGHMANIKRLAAAGKLLIAGPFDLPDDAPMSAPVGIFVFTVGSVDEARQLVATDPTIAAGWFAADVYPWYGPGGLTYDGAEAPAR